MKEYVITKDTNSTFYEVWNVYLKKTVPNPVVRKNNGIKTKRVPSDYEKIKMSQVRLQVRKNKPSKKLMKKM